MKLHHILFNITLTVFLFFSAQYQAQKKFIIVLDAGHGGKDIGATRKYTDLGTVMEKNVTLAVVLKLGRLLEKDKDFKVIYTRKIDEFPSLLDRTHWQTEVMQIYLFLYMSILPKHLAPLPEEQKPSYKALHKTKPI